AQGRRGRGCGRRQRRRSRRGVERRLGHARRGGECRSLQRGPAARRDRSLSEQACNAVGGMNDEDFNTISGLVRERSGLVLARDKTYLLESRLLPVARKYNRKSLADIAALLRGRPDPDLVRDIVEAMTTNESFFFRDIKPFDQFKQFVLPQMMKARGAAKSLRIWSAACSSGQEP